MKKTRKIIAILLCTLLALSGFSAFAVYETPIEFSEVVFYDADGETVIDGPQIGGFYAEAAATYEGSAERSAVMLCAIYDKETGEIQKIAMSDNNAQWPGDASQILRCEMADVTDVENYEFKCFFIDDLMRHTLLNNGAPAAPDVVEAVDSDETSIDVKWEEAVDDFDNVESYEVYKNGAHIGTTTELEFTVPDLLRNSESVISVRANDGKLLSEAVKSAPLATKKIVENIFDFNFVHGQMHTVEGSGLAAVMSTGSHEFKECDTVNGRRCAITSKYPGFAAADQEYITEADNELVFELTYLDKLPEGITSALIYMNAQTIDSNSLSAIPRIYNPLYHPVYNNSVDEIVTETAATAAPKITNTGVWKTAVVKFANVSFVPGGAAGQLGKQFYVRSSNKDVALYLASGNLYKPGDYIPMNPNMQVVAGGQTVYAMEFTTPGGFDVAYAIEEVDGVKCVKSLDANNLSYKVTDIATVNAPQAALEVTFYDDNAGDILNVGTHEILMDGSGWRTAIIDITGAELGAGFEIYKNSDTIVFLKDLHAYVK